MKRRLPIKAAKYRSKSVFSNCFPSMKTNITIVLVVGLLAWAYWAIQPPPPIAVGVAGGPPVTSPRVRLTDGRYLAYMVAGVPKEEAQHKIIIVHGYSGSKNMTLPFSKEIIEELRVCFLTYDRAGYGDSDPNLKRSVKTEAFDVQELADKLQLGPKFYVIGISMGAYTAWSCLYYIPHRLSGLSFVVPFANYYWRGLPTELANERYKRLPVSDQWTFRVAHYAPWLFNWWMTQNLFPKTAGLIGDLFTPKDLEILMKLAEGGTLVKEQKQGSYVSLHQDMIAAFGEWEFDPLDLTNPFPNNEGFVHMWQGSEDKIIPLELNRYVAQKLPWIGYHELPGVGHMLFDYKDVSDTFLREILLT